MAGHFRIEMFNLAEEEINFDSFVKFPLSCFKLVFFDFEPLKINPTVRDQLKYFAKLCFYRSCIVICALSVISLTMFSLLTAEDLLTASMNVPNAVLSTLVTLKMIVVLQNRERIWIIFNDLRDQFGKHESENGKYKIKIYLDGYHTLAKANAMFMLSAVLSVIKPTFMYFFAGTMKLSVNYWYPFDPSVPRNFPFALLWMDLLTWLFPAFWLSLDTLLYALVTVVAMEFDILKTDFLEIKLTPEEQRMTKMKSLVQRHNGLFAIADKLQQVYSIIFFVCFVISSLVMCYVAFIISTARDFAVYSFYIPLLSLAVGQIFLMCYCGQKLLDSSVDLADGVYNCGWEELNDIKFTKHCLLNIARAQKPQRLSAMGFCDLTLENFTSVS